MRDASGSEDDDVLSLKFGSGKEAGMVRTLYNKPELVDGNVSQVKSWVISRYCLTFELIPSQPMMMSGVKVSRGQRCHPMQITSTKDEEEEEEEEEEIFPYCREVRKVSTRAHRATLT